jgi:hypothetical protein
MPDEARQFRNVVSEQSLAPRFVWTDNETEAIPAQSTETIVNWAMLPFVGPGIVLRFSVVVLATFQNRHGLIWRHPFVSLS